MSQSINPSAPTVVLVHGTFADSSSWNAVTPSLFDQGYPVVAVANPLRGLKSDTDYVAAVLKSVAGPIVLVGHSYAGSAIRNAPTRVANVVAPVFFPAAHPMPSRLHQRPSRRSGWKSTPVCFIYPELHKTIPAALHAFTAQRASSKRDSGGAGSLARGDAGDGIMYLDRQGSSPARFCTLAARQIAEH